MRGRIAIIYNQPEYCRYNQSSEEAAVIGVLEAVNAVHTALQKLDYSVIKVPLVPPLKQAVKTLKQLDVDLVFNLFEGFCGYPDTEADVADALAKNEVPYTGSPGKALRLALDKASSKTQLKSKSIATPNFQLLNNFTVADFHLRYPCIIKPAAEDASHGLSEKSIVHDSSSLKEQLVTLQRNYKGKLLVEEFIDGREFNITIMGNSMGYFALPISEIKYFLPQGKPRILTFEAKWKPDSLYYKSTKVICPAEITDPERLLMEKTAMAAFKMLGCYGYARVDMRLNNNRHLYVLEVNPNPDISPTSGIIRQAKSAGLTYVQFINRIIQLTLEAK